MARRNDTRRLFYAAPKAIGAGTMGKHIMDKDYRPPLSLSETAHALGTTEQVVRRALLRGELKGFKVGREWRITREAIEHKIAGAAV